MWRIKPALKLYEAPKYYRKCYFSLENGTDGGKLRFLEEKKRFAFLVISIRESSPLHQ